ncbi:MAG: hypothetical protein KIT72_09265 [Polyangiaceae bacterium]|nr:hypothetical protein [Polyangiaceae bacterium]MCW5790598.1 hypothetical protein [Polyangiaceae bacterium]
MTSPALRLAFGLLSLSAWLACTAPALGAASDAEVSELRRVATSDLKQGDPLKAESRLKTAIATCRSGDCSPHEEAAVWGTLGIVYASSLDDQESASAAFQEMLRLHPDSKPDKSLTDGAVTRAFEAALQAREEEAARRREQEAARRKRVEEAQAARIAEHQARLKDLRRQRLKQEELRREEERLEQEQIRAEQAALEEEERQLRCDVEAPLLLPDAGWVEQALSYPVPLFIPAPELTSETMTVGEVKVEYRAPGEAPRTLQLKPMSGGYGALLPCEASKRAGELTYVISVYNGCGNLIGSAGTEGAPRRVELKSAVDFKQPHLPGELPPKSCVKGEPILTCEFDDDCPGVGGRCDEGVCINDPPKITQAVRASVRRSRLSLSASLDVAPISSDAACATSSVDEGQYSCFVDGEAELDADPLAPGSFNSAGLGALRVSLGYDHVLGDRWTLGARGGVTLLGHPSRSDGKRVLPFHLDARFAAYLGEAPFARQRVRALIFLNGGLAESAGRIDGVTVRSRTLGERDVSVWQKGGSLFAGGGVGLELPIAGHGGISLDLSARRYFIKPLTAFGPTLGYVHSL